MKYIAPFLLSSLLVGCATFPSPSQNGDGRLVIFSEVKQAYSLGDSWNYQIWVKNQETEEKAIINVNVDRFKKFYFSKPLAPGTYEIFGLNAIGKDNEDPSHDDLKGSFVIKPDTMTLFDQKLLINKQDDVQTYRFELIDEASQPEFEQILKEASDNFLSWQVEWMQSDEPVVISNPPFGFKAIF